MRNANLPKAKANKIPAELIAESFALDSKSPSWLRWKERPRKHFLSERGWRCFSSRFAGTPAGAITVVDGVKRYWLVRVSGYQFLVHRLVYSLCHGVDPELLTIDHLDHNGLNNNPVNLRLSTNIENSRNRDKNKNNTSGHRGVYWRKNNKKWKAYINIHGKHISLGQYHLIEDAIAARITGELKYFGEYSYVATQSAIHDSDEILGDAGWAY